MCSGIGCASTLMILPPSIYNDDDDDIDDDREDDDREDDDGSDDRDLGITIHHLQ